MSDAIERLTSLFVRFPGIGPRQAQRFVQFLLRSSPTTRKELIEAVRSLAGSVQQCSLCMRYHSGEKKICSICNNPERDAECLAIIASDVDLTALERTHTFRGLYFVLGGTISLAQEKTNGLRIKQFVDSLPARIKASLKEIILAFPANPEGDVTSARIREELEKHRDGASFVITTLGRGLSTGSELEYADPDTIKSALENRR
ncbi:recombination protein RecR [Candidatus Kaiserbacteria bacterium CG10_big_fil_rev_8_21_14_0_10_51_14]|uniref:Recombination protein RecR n=1 Tax=Candidatus Kaiserbacteria bacterium CG10_big_fil_rev_8_21_14_0_10_51_14 TaxID=1974610 RepID=A0A2H0UB76_9BACT|nr:MAG: recombination protein RecR [Candidatus Kaiserbacteria bacterium CG10_big_fil_rev_8_21_14_0_10_51_14]